MPAYSKLDQLGGTTRQARKQARRTAEAKEIATCYAAVDARDEGRCRVCGKRGSTQSIGVLERLHRHHMIYRSRGGEHVAAQVVTLCALCHTAIHVNGDLRVDGDADLRNERGKLAGVRVQRLEESGWKVQKFC